MLFFKGNIANFVKLINLYTIKYKYIDYEQN